MNMATSAVLPSATALAAQYFIDPHLEYRTVCGVNGPLVILEKVKSPKYAEIVQIRLGDGSIKRGQVLEVYVEA